ncbi:MAG: phosphoribosylanthranilate isomerase [Actinobacteria bacterium]|jgi:phosphoribosylanthranilate isomerase|nr:phosphoribosylanthranilate isomerase [Actinomycetota bacterium]NCU81814.1 phosphoribosylanthranilate isomerase [Acidimicrobiia bacterium]HBQ51800.1 N-(5'-phosphoribosyl)anthranilate isomerase [Acidimicrobium sp.]NBQ03889.1 phosphoribosylanthranilate isomerase [Actinomycetota bacterium]NCU86966.1 phosphoribosylanthranilate isomerase [Actinomycetota bacterium]
MFVKICGITNEQDALLAVALGADALGFVFAPSPRQVAPQRVKEIVRRLPQSVLTVGVFRDEHPQRVIDIVHEAGVFGAQLHGHESAANVAEVMVDIKWVIKAVVAGSVEAQKADDYLTDLILVDSPNPGSGSGYEFDLLKQIPESVRVLLAGGLTADNVATAIAKVTPWGVDVSSGVEKSHGYKDPIKMKKFIENARSAFGNVSHGANIEESKRGNLPFNWET